MEDPFAQVARDYDRMFLRDLEVDREMLLNLLERYDAKTVLDCACGTGVHTEIVAREGFRVVGSDASADMLRVARSKLAAAGLEVDLYESLWRDLPDVVPGTYDAVICLGNSLPLELDGDSVVTSLEGMFAMLNDGGFLLISNANVDRQLAERVELELVEPEPDCFLLLVKDFGSDTAINRYFFIDTLADEPSMRYLRVELMNLTAEKMQSFLRQAGIDRYTLYGEKDFTPYDREASERLILVVEKT